MSATDGIVNGVLLIALLLPGPGADAPVPLERVARADIVEAIAAERGYDRTVTTNMSRLQSHVFLRLLRQAGTERGRGVRLFVDHTDWFAAYLEAVGVAAAEAPISARLSHEHQCDIYLDARRDGVVEAHAGPEAPLLAANVRWISRRGTDSYSYRDELSDPVLDLSFAGDVSYRLVELKDMIVFDEIHGVSGRPVTGALGLLFKLLGSASARWSRSAIAEDGWQVVRGHGTKGPFSRTATVTVRPDGRVDKDVPADRPDLARLDERLRRDPGLSYHPWPTH